MEKDLEAGVTIIAENSTSALDAIQILLGATGNAVDLSPRIKFERAVLVC